MHIAYQITTQFELIDKVRARYSSDLDQLKDLGFEELCFYTERLFPFSFLVLFPIFLLMRSKREVIHIQNPLRITASYPLLVASTDATCALVMGLGIKFYTPFSDGTGLISANFPTDEIQDRREKLYKYAIPQPLAAAWQFHRDRLQMFRAQGRAVREWVGFEGYVELSRREEDHRNTSREAPS